MPRIYRISLGAKVRQHVMADASLALVTHGGDVDRGNDNPLARPGGCLRKQTAIVIDDLTAARP